MLTTQFIHMEILNLNLSGNTSEKPKPASARPPLIVTLTGSGNFILEGSEYNLLQLKDKMKPLLEKNKENDILLVSKKIASVQDVVTAIDYIKNAGGKNISLAEDKENDGK